MRPTTNRNLLGQSRIVSLDRVTEIIALQARDQRAGGALCVIAILFFAGLAHAQQDERFGTDVELERASLEELAKDLREFEDYANRIIDDTGDRIQEYVEDRDQWRRMREWHETMSVRVHDALVDDKPIEALLDAWAMGVQMVQYLTEGDGREVFGEAQPIAIDAADRIKDRIRLIAFTYLPDRTFNEIEDDITRYTQENPLKRDPNALGRFFDFGAGLFSLGDRGIQSITKIANVPFQSGKVLRNLLPDLPYSEVLRQLNENLLEFTDVIRTMPFETRKEFETLLVNLEDEQTTVSAMLSELRAIVETANQAVLNSDRVTSGAAETVSRIADATPQLQEIADTIVDAMQEATKLVEAVDSLMEEFTQADAPGGAKTDQDAPGFDPKQYTEAARAIEGGSAEIRSLLGEIREMIESGQDDEPADPSNEAHPFDVREYREAAEAIQAGVAEVRAGLGDVESGDLSESLDEIQARATGYTEQVIDHLAVRLAQLLGLAFILSLTFVFLRRRIAPES